MIDWNEFVKAWQSSRSYKEVAMKVNRKVDTVRVYAHRLRKKGVPLKVMSSRPGPDVPALQALVRELEQNEQERETG